MAQRKRGERVLGPYAHAGRWRLIVVGPGGEKTRQDYESKGEAEKVRRCVERELRTAEERTIGEAKTEYMRYLLDVKGNKPGSVDDVMYRLGVFFVDVDEDKRGKQVVRDLGDDTLGSITPAKGEALYASLRSRKTQHGGMLAVDSHRTILAAAKTFFRWCVVEKKCLTRNPLELVKGIGKVRHGKEQLRIDEARKWMVEAHRQADAGQAGAVAVAAMTALVMGMRASEIVSRVVRDLDDGGALLWIPDSKTLAGGGSCRFLSSCSRISSSWRGVGIRRRRCSGSTGETGRGNGFSGSARQRACPR
jgi:integrase